MANKGTNDSKVFRYFLGKVIEARNNIFGNIDYKIWCVIDNASIHKTIIIKEYAERNKVCLITIPAYSPSLNAVESLIQSVKAKIKNLGLKESK